MRGPTTGELCDTDLAGRPAGGRARGRRAWLSRREILLMGALTCVYLFAFAPSSPIFGPTEIFLQDTPYIVDGLTSGAPYRYNPQHHLLYHVLVENSWSLIERLLPAGTAPFWFLKVVTAITGLAYLLALAFLLRELGLSAGRRAVLVALGGVSISVWFNATAFETHALGMPALTVAYALLVRLARGGERGLTRAEGWVLAVCLGGTVLCRIEYVGLVVVGGAVSLLLVHRTARRSLAIALGAAVPVAVAGYALMGHVYFEVPWRSVPATILARDDRPSLQHKLMTADNLRWRPLKHMLVATNIYSFAIPTEHRGFREYLSDMLDEPLAVVVMSIVAGLMLRTWFATGRAIARRRRVALLLAVLWTYQLLLYTWFNPHEPFLWLLEFSPLSLALIGLAHRDAGGLARLHLLAVPPLLLVHNALFFWWQYR